MKRIKSFGVIQTAKVAGILYFLLSFVIFLPVILLGSAFGNRLFPGLNVGIGMLLVLIPLLYGFIGFVMTAICCAVYNLIVQWTGGIELEVETTDSQPS
jgi:hypothetical protein